MPKAIITNRNTNWVEQSLTEFDFKYSRAKKRQDDEILMTNIDDFKYCDKNRCFSVNSN